MSHFWDVTECCYKIIMSTILLSAKQQENIKWKGGADIFKVVLSLVASTNNWLALSPPLLLHRGNHSIIEPMLCGLWTFECVCMCV